SVSSSFVDRSRAAHALHSFPTRRSSDLLALSLSLLLAWRKRLALLPLVPVLLISLASLGEEYLGWRLGTGEWLFRHGLIVEGVRSEEHTSELQSRENLVCRLLLEKKKTL